jgi:hypothetical protein
MKRRKFERWARAATSPVEMQVESPPPRIELSRPEAEVVLRALGYFQIHLFDELSNLERNKQPGGDPGNTAALGADIQHLSSAIKKVHRFHEESLKRK